MTSFKHAPAPTNEWLTAHVPCNDAAPAIVEPPKAKPGALRAVLSELVKCPARALTRPKPIKFVRPPPRLPKVRPPTTLAIARRAQLQRFRQTGTPASTCTSPFAVERACVAGLLFYDHRLGLYRLTDLGELAADIIETP